ncbi:MAG: NADP-dependent malic enzyme [Proteobacteria bacterium]|nr:NADP-dependent malic enzyme [Pseudomonadota bacterium]
MPENLDEMSLEYHRSPTPGKISVVPTKSLANQRDLALAYSPGVAAACNLIAKDPSLAAEFTVRSNLVAVVTNGTAVLGLGNIGPLAAKPVMEGKGVLFKKFADVNVFDLEIAETDPEKFIDIVASLEPTFGGINLEDIKAPECFVIEKALRERMNIPVFHDDQHGTSICVAAAVYNGLHVVGKDIKQIRLVCSGAGAAALACLDLLVRMGLPKTNILIADRAGIVYEGREGDMDPYKARYARKTNVRTMREAMEGSDVFLGLSAPDVVDAEMVKSMAEKPLILALANPDPEILPEVAKEARPDAVIATGRSDYPNQVNNVLCFPFIFRGALDVGATTINEEMKLACVYAIADLAKAEASDVVARAYGDQTLSFGPEYLIPKPFDPRLIVKLAPAVAKAAMDSGVATRPIKDFAAYEAKLSQYVYRSGMAMKPVFDRARENPLRLCYADGEEENVLRAVQIVLDDGLAKPILIGRRYVIEMRLERLGLRFNLDEDVDLTDPENDPRYREYWTEYHAIMQRKGVSPDVARTIVRTRTSVIGALMVRRKEADAMICGVLGRYDRVLRHVQDVLGLRPGVRNVYAVELLILPTGTVFITDTNVNYDPSAEDIAEAAILGAELVAKFGLTPKVALLSHSNFGSSGRPSAVKMRDALSLITARAPELEVEGEMNADTALNETIRERLFPNSELKGPVNLLVMPTLDAAKIAFDLVRSMGQGLSVGPMLVGIGAPAHIVTPSITVRGLVNMSALAVVDAQVQAQTRDQGQDSGAAAG